MIRLICFCVDYFFMKCLSVCSSEIRMRLLKYLNAVIIKVSIKTKLNKNKSYKTNFKAVNFLFRNFQIKFNSLMNIRINRKQYMLFNSGFSFIDDIHQVSVLHKAGELQLHKHQHVNSMW